MSTLAWLFAAAIVLPAASAGASSIENVGHRGFSEAYPENTIVALEAAFAAGADRVEIDLLKSSDGEVVVFHDDTVDRTTNGTGNVADLTLAQLQALDAGSWFAPQFAGETIPTLNDALLAADGLGPLLLDQKSDLLFGAEIAAALQATLFPVSDIFVTAWNEAQVADIQANVPGALIIWTAQVGPFPGGPPDPIGEFLTDMAALGVDGFSFISEYYDAFVPGFVTQAQQAGFLTYAWNFSPQTVAKMESMIQIGIDGYIVNDVGTFAAVIPEPATGMLLAAGLAGLGMRTRRGARLPI